MTGFNAFMSGLMAVVYPLLYWTATLVLRTAGIFDAKIREGLRLRRAGADGKEPWLKGPARQQPVWIHCASYEFEYAKPVIAEIKRRDPEQKVLVTYFSPSVRAAIEQFPGVDLVAPLPWDRVKDLREFLDYHHPRALLIARTDTWPVMLQQTRRHKIPSLLFAATLSTNAGRLKPGVRDFTKWILANLDTVFCVSDADREQLLKLGVTTDIEVAGDTRYDQVIARMKAPKPLKRFIENVKTSQQDQQNAPSLPPPESVAPNLSSPRILVAGSTWEEDENQLIQCLVLLRRQQIENLQTILVPHEPTPLHLATLERKLSEANLRFLRYSQIETSSSPSPFQQHSEMGWPPNCDVLLIDQVGILAELYAVGEFAFVGGSFRKTVHSVMEPLAAGCLTFLGPLHTNNREALELKNVTTPLEDFKCVNSVRDGKEWAEKLALALDSSTFVCRQFILDQVRIRSGRTNLVVDWFFARRRRLD